ncbi:MAG: SUMF1/EgtB/PvdO family nonheme iron enzyme, partial [Henriciella sp.]|nr:SUMF1/EgtB/PvdO family nonheme iron enzyme [Henriciella sp.]
VGSFAAYAYGVHDLIGYVWEGTSSPFSPSHEKRDVAIAGETGLAPRQQATPVGAIKGGSFLCADNYCARFRPAARQAQDLTFGTSHIGFRIAREAAD